MADLHTTHICRHLQSTECYPKLRFPFRDETGKITVAKYKLVGLLKGRIEGLDNYVYRLDARSVRYMKRVVVVENERSFYRKFPTLRRLK